MVLERSFDSADLKRLLLDSEMVVDRSLLTSSPGRADPTRISRPPLPRGSQVFEKVLDEFQPERQCPDILVSDTAGTTARAGQPHPHPHPHAHHHHRRHHHLDVHHLSPYDGRSRSNSRCEGGRSRAGSPRPGSRSPSRPGSGTAAAAAAAARSGVDHRHRPGHQSGHPSPGSSTGP